MQEEKELENPSSENSTSDFTDHVLKIEFDGNCDHYYEDTIFNQDGYQECQCKKCPMGKQYDKSVYTLVEGQLRRTNETMVKN